MMWLTDAACKIDVKSYMMMMMMSLTDDACKIDGKAYYDNDESSRFIYLFIYNLFYVGKLP